VTEQAPPPPPDDDALVDGTMPLSTMKRIGIASVRPPGSQWPPANAPIAATVPPPEGTMRQVLVRLRRSRNAMLGLVALCGLLLLSVFADLLASDLPILCRVQGTVYVLPAVTHPAALAGWDNARVDAEAGPGGFSIAPLVPFGPRQTASGATVAPLAAPSFSRTHPLGTDAFGRDVFARLVHGARTAMSIALLAVLAFVSLGTILGALAGFFGGPFDGLVSRVVETLTAFPTLILVLVVQALVPHPTTTTLLVTLALTRWTEVARLVRAEVLLITSQDYVLAARALGASPARVLLRHVAPNARAPVLVSATFGLASVVLIEAALEFLHVGLPGPVPSWGEMLSESRDHLAAWWLLVFPGLSLFLSVVALNLVGEALRDALDPRLHAAVGGTGATPTLGGGDRPTIAPSSTAFDGTTHA
jgi:peptide/nickel transport system permease protein